MITKNPMQLKAYIKKKAAEKHISAQLVMQNYMLERLLERISLSPYKHNFIIKGGFLVSAIVGLDTRATMDLDTTIKGFTLTHEAILSIFKDVCAVQIDDDVQFEVVGVADIRETDDYPGIRVSLKANYPPISVPLTAQSAFWPTISKQFWPKSWKPYCPAILQTPVREITMTSIFYMPCAEPSAIRQRCGGHWNGQRKNAAVLKS